MTQPAGAGRVLFEEWAATSPPTLDGPRPPCPVCGHPTYDCTTHVWSDGTITVAAPPAPRTY